MAPRKPSGNVRSSGKLQTSSTPSSETPASSVPNASSQPSSHYSPQRGSSLFAALPNPPSASPVFALSFLGFISSESTLEKFVDYIQSLPRWNLTWPFSLDPLLVGPSWTLKQYLKSEVPPAIVLQFPGSNVSRHTTRELLPENTLFVTLPYLTGSKPNEKESFPNFADPPE
jgi:hypothetical protein